MAAIVRENRETNGREWEAGADQRQRQRYVRQYNQFRSDQADQSNTSKEITS